MSSRCAIFVNHMRAILAGMQRIGSLATSLLRPAAVFASTEVGRSFLLSVAALLILPAALVGLLAALWFVLYGLIDVAHLYGIPEAVTFLVTMAAMIVWAGMIAFGTALLARLATKLVDGPGTPGEAARL